MLVALLLACSMPSGPAPVAPAPAPVAPAPTPPPPVPAGPDPAWDVVGFWDATAIAPGCTLSVVRWTSIGSRPVLDCGDAEPPDRTLGTPVLDGTRLRIDVAGAYYTLDRWRPEDVKVLPSDAVVRAVAAWNAQRPDPAVVESVQESADFFTFGSGTDRDWVVHIENPHSPNTAVMPATLTIDVDVATGQTGGIEGR